MTITAGKLWGMRRLADAEGRYKMLAVDQRPPIKNLIRERRGVAEASYGDVAAVKRTLAAALAPQASAVLLDPHVAYPQAIDLISPAQGVIVTLEDSIFQETPGGRLSSEITDWSVAKIKRTGADAVKVLTWYRPDADAAVCRHQQDFTRAIGEACRRHDIPFVFELLVYPLAGDRHQTTDYVEHADKKPELVLESVAEFAKPEYGVDIFKLESPVPAAGIAAPESGAAAARNQALFDELGRLAGRPWVMLSAGAGKDDFETVLRYAYRAGANGYLAGRAIWWQAFQAFPDLDAMTAGLQADGVAYMRRLNALTDEAATPWQRHPLYGGAPELDGRGERFRESYADFGAAP
ncbi:MAG: tagatose 1,6-diphosphate aldolase [Azospirillaceae bacterium]